MENKKRGVSEGDDDEMKMEKFYSLLRSFRDARDRRRRELLELEEKNEKNMNKKMKAKAEDFTTEIQFRKPPLIFPNPIPCDTTKDNKGKKNKEQHQDLALDLKLAL
ncbi:hypothetical protein CR513_47069, partial [Mucuna pruriens]